MEKSVDQINNQLNNILRPLFENKTFLASSALFFALYAGMLAPKLPNSVIHFFDTTLGKFIFIFSIAFVASRNLPNSMNISLILSFIFLITITTLNNVKLQEDFKNLGQEHFQMMNNYNKDNNNNSKRNTLIPLIETLENEIASMVV